MARKSKSKFPRNLGMQHVGRQLPRFGKGKDVFETVEIRRLWPEVVGEYLAEKTYVKKVYYQKLIVSVQHGGWAYQLNMMKSDILSNLNRKSKIKISEIQWQQEDFQHEHAPVAPKQLRNKFDRPQEKMPENKTLKEILDRVRSLQKQIPK